jgi:penicillin-binding protein 2
MIRKYLLGGLVVGIGLIFIGKLFMLQIYTEQYDIENDNAVRKEFIYPKRGYIFDRNNTLLVANEASYDVMVIPREVKAMDTLEFCKILAIELEKFKSSLEKANRYSPRLPSVFVAQLAKKEYAMLAEKMHKFNGFYIQKRDVRDYKTDYAANILGFIAEVNNNTMASDSYYNLGDLIGKQGVEKSYEDLLRGQKGVRYVQKDRFNRIIGSVKNGAYDTIPIPGKDLTLTIDIELQAYGEQLMTKKRGGIVALDPQSGEILALVSAPSYNPQLLVGRERSTNYNLLNSDTINRPLFDRGLLQMFPPGSPFKTLTGVLGLQEGVVNPTQIYTCNGSYIYGRNNRRMICHCGGGKRNLISAIAKSCNSYFADVYRRSIEKYPSASKGMDVWSNHLKSFGLGNFLGYDLPIGKRGLIPDGDYYDRRYPDFRWGATTTLSNAIGQGEILSTPIQMANWTAAIANKGFFFKPHLLKPNDNYEIDEDYVKPINTSIEPQYFEPIIEGMSEVFTSGTASFLNVPGIDICGKTGTAENYTKINGKRVQLTDHSIFMAFAPKEDPKIAIAVFVENGYYGARWAGRISSLMIEKYLKGEVTLKAMEALVLSKSLEEEYQKPYSGKPFLINQ